MKMIRIGLIAFLLTSIVGSAVAQVGIDQKKDRKARRLEKKQQRREAVENRLTEVEQMLDEQSFVLEANTLQGRYGTTAAVNANNFIKIDNGRFVLQTSNPLQIGLNGLGGITATGSVMDYRVINNEKNNTMSVIAQVSTATVGQGTLTIRASGSGYDSATFTNNWGGRITFNGPITPVEETMVYEGLDRLGV